MTRKIWLCGSTVWTFGWMLHAFDPYCYETSQAIVMALGPWAFGLAILYAKRAA